MKSKLRGMPASTRMRLSCLEHSALCMLEKDSVGPGGLPSKAVGPITRTKALACANRKLEAPQEEQPLLQGRLHVRDGHLDRSPAQEVLGVRQRLCGAVVALRDERNARVGEAVRDAQHGDGGHELDPAVLPLALL